MQSIIVRQLRLLDIARVLAIQSDCYRDEVIESAASFISKQKASPETCFVCVVDGYVEGYLVSVPGVLGVPPALDCNEYSIPVDFNCLHLHDLAVSANSRQLGVGRLLVDAYFEIVREKGIERATLIAIQQSASYWEQYGFTKHFSEGALQRDLAGYGSDAVYMIA